MNKPVSSNGHFPRRIAYCFIPHFPVAVEVRENSSLLGKPVVIRGKPYDDEELVFDASPQAIEQGVRPGMPLRYAYSLCPEACFLPRDIPKYKQAFDEILSVLDCFSPKVEPDALGSAFLNMSGSEALFGPDQIMARRIVDAIREKTGLHARVGIAGTKFAAQIAALEPDGNDFLVVSPGQETDFLKPFPVEILTDDEEMQRRLRLLGIERVSDYGELPVGSVAVQFGKKGQTAYQLAMGVDNNPVLGRTQSPIFEIHQTYWEPIDNLQWLFAEVDALLDSLVVQLDEGGWMCQRVELFLEFENEVSQQVKMALDTPTSSFRELQGRVHKALERQTYKAPVTGIRIAFSGLTSLNGKQLSLETMTVRQQRRLRAAVEHLRVKYGPGRIKRAWIMNPKALIPSQRFVVLEYGETPGRERDGP